MRKILLTAAASVAALLSLSQAATAQTFSQPIFNGSVGYSNYSADEADDVNLGAVTGRFGVRVHPNFGAEVEGSIGVNDDEVAPGVDAELDHQIAAYALGVVPLSPNAEIFGRLGYGNTELSVEGGGLSVDGDNDSVNYGVGGAYYFDGANGVRADYTRFDFRDDGGEADVLSLSYTRRF